MPSLITLWDRGVTIASCNESCYTSKDPDCFCICGGENHGVGREQAELNTAISGVSWIAKRVRASERDPWTIRAQILGFRTSVPGALKTE